MKCFYVTIIITFTQIFSLTSLKIELPNKVLKNSNSIQSKYFHQPTSFIAAAGRTNDIQFELQNTRPDNRIASQVTAASIGTLFVVLIWKLMIAFELADQITNTFQRNIATISLCIVLICNVAGFLFNIFSPLMFKSYLKIILAINMLREFISMMYNIFNMVFPSQDSNIPPEAYFLSIAYNLWIGILCYSFSKSRWVMKYSGSSAERGPRFV
jgi:hypothetical protein